MSQPTPDDHGDAQTAPGLPRLPPALERRLQPTDGPTAISLDGLELRLGPELILPQLPDGAASPRVFRVRAAAAASISPSQQERARLLFVGEAASAAAVERLYRALEATSAERPGALLPLPLDYWSGPDEALLLTDDHLGEKISTGGSPWWRQQPLALAVQLLAQLAGALDVLHRAGYALGGVHLEHMMVSQDLSELALAQLGALTPLRALARHTRQRAIRDDLRALGVLALEAATGREDAALLENFHKVLDDAQILIDAGVARPGLSQVLLGTLTAEPPFAYQSARDLLQGLMQLQAELSPRLRVLCGMASSVGNFPLRRTDQDSCGVAEVRIIYHGVPRHVGFYCVADGVGGEEHGERASQAAIQAAIQGFHKALEAWPFETLRANASTIARSIVKIAAQELAIAGEVEPDENRGATTFTCALIAGDRAGIGHLGDSRAYLLRDERMICLTRDHNVANMKAALGQMTGRRAEEREDDQRRISRFLSTSAETPLSWIDGFDPRLLHNLVHPWELPSHRNATPGALYSPQSTFTTIATSPVPPPSLSAQPRKRHNDKLQPQTLEFAQGAERRVFDATTEQETRHATLPLRPGDQLILMSDGLYGELNEAEMAALMLSAPHPEDAATALLHRAMRGLAMDNITALVVSLQEIAPNYKR